MHRPSVLLGHYDDTAVLAFAESSADELLQLVDVSAVLRYDGSLGTCGNGAVLRQESRIATHHLDKEYPVVGGGCVTDLVHTFHNGVERSVIADGGVCAVKVIVDSPRKPDARYIEFLGKYLRSGQRTVSPDDDKGVDTVCKHVVIRFLAALRSHELL